MPKMTMKEIEKAYPRFQLQIDACEKCGISVQVGEWPWCPHGFPGGHSHMKPVEVEIDGVVHRIDSIRAADNLERESARRAANGEGQKIALRVFNQDRSNMDRNTFGSNEQIRPRGVTQRGLPITVGSRPYTGDGRDHGR